MTGKTFSNVLIIGKNSKIVKCIRHNLLECDFIAHDEIDSVSLDKYRKIFVFSWSYISQSDNIRLITKLPLARVVLISSIAVLACARRRQWAAYPNAKLECENIVLEGGGQIIRVGIWDQAQLKNLPGLVPMTTPEMLINSIESCLLSPKNVYYPIELKDGELFGVKLIINNLINRISLSLPSLKFFQIPLAVLSKVLGYKNYGYTNDCLYFFCNRVLVGFGAVGSSVSKALNLKGLNHSIVASDKDNQLLVKNGFNGTRIGAFREGLSNLWHGVWISGEEDAKNFEKKVPIFVSRPRLPRCAVIGCVVAIDVKSLPSSIIIDHPIIADVRVHSNIIHLAAGVVNNIKIIQKTHKIVGEFSDQEVCVIGEVESKELESKGIIARKFGLVFGRKVHKDSFEKSDYLLDFRPKALSNINFDAQNIYNNKTDQIIMKLVKSCSLALINQAIFNKFGMSFDVGKFSIVAQIEAPNCISLTEDGDLHRSRLSKYVIDGISEKISVKFSTYRKADPVCTSDAIHLYGGFALVNHPDLNELVKSQRLFIHGNVFKNERLGAFHNTVRMINSELAAIKNV